MTEALRRTVLGEPSFLLRRSLVELAISESGAMMAPVTFFPNSSAPITPYAVAPWAGKPRRPDIPPMLQTLRGDWFCSAFGGNEEPWQNAQLPPHGETANLPWRLVEFDEGSSTSQLILETALPLQGGACRATTLIRDGESVVYQRHELSGLTGPINPGHHATLVFPESEGAARLSFSPHIAAYSFVEPVERPEEGGFSSLMPGQIIENLRAAPCADGSTTDLTSYPSRRGFEDIAIVCADPTCDFGWSAAAVPVEGYVWFALRDPRQLASTLLWFSNGGRHYPPWNGRHVNVLGIEDITAFFHVGLGASAKANKLSDAGIPTVLMPSREGRLSIGYIQGIARIPRDFDRVATIERCLDGRGVVMKADSGAAIAVDLDLDFLNGEGID